MKTLAAAAISLSLGLTFTLALATCSSGTSGGTGGHGAHDAGISGGNGGGGGVADAGSDATDASDAGDGGRDLSPNKAAFFGPSRCAQADVLLCEDFESGTLDTSVWQVSGDMPVIDGVQKARGEKALHITKTGSGLSYIRETKTFPAPNNTYWGRLFVYFDKLPTSPGMSYAHWTFAAASGTGVQGEIRLSGQLSQGNNLFGVGTDSGGSPDGTGDWTNSDQDPNGMPSAVPTQEWLCIEWMHKGDTNETRFFWDAVEHPSLYTSATMHGGNNNPYLLPELTNLWIGWQEYQSSTETFEMWVDEIIVDKERIGCVL
jgi:hypothetical protein